MVRCKCGKEAKKYGTYSKVLKRKQFDLYYCDQCKNHIVLDIETNQEIENYKLANLDAK